MATVAENAIKSDDQFIHHSSSVAVATDSKDEFQSDVRKLVDLLSKLNPSAKEFFPSSYSADHRLQNDPVLVDNKDSSSDGSSYNRRKRNNYNHWRRRANGRNHRAQRDDSIRRTVYVSDIDQNVTEERLAALFINCGQVVDCRVCGDPHSILRFAFVEFADEQGARAALNLSGTMLGYYPVKVLPSKTAILPVNPTFLPRSEDEREMCARTVYCTNIDKKVSQTDVKFFFQSICGEVSRLRLLGDHMHSTRIAFVEFVSADSAIGALNCSGMPLGSLPVRYQKLYQPN
ncbi:polyadenylate-binding protein-interacting protein 9-like isoform X2 [Tasmannia lanceolata]|uniref:polyadenylate-binding protein-interacting protein 9-like isoform X2 n=1 Tax=Tasmannia lanceolata TaxID=3420 RepID=UPI004063E9B8